MMITQTTPDHLPQIAQLEQQLFQTPWSLQTLQDTLNQPSTHFMTALHDDKVLGYGSYQNILDEGYINNIATHPQHQRQGIARKLLDSLWIARSPSLLFLSLEVRESNLPAIALYQSQHFQQIAVRKNYYQNPRENALIFNKYPETN